MGKAAAGHIADFPETFAVSHVHSQMLQVGILFISKPVGSFALWIQGQLDEVCLSPEFNTLVQIVGRFFPVRFL